MTETIAFDTGEELCPPYWPGFLWDLLHPRPHVPGGGPVELVGEMDDVLAGLAINALSHRLADQERAGFVRSTVADAIVKTASQLPGRGEALR